VRSLLILLPLAGLILLNLPGGLLSALALPAVAALAIFEIVLAVFLPAARGTPVLENLQQLLHLSGPLDSLSRVLLLSIGIVGLASVLVLHATIKAPRRRFNMANVMLISLMGMNGVILVRDLFSLYVFLEVTAVSSFVLIASSGDEAGLEGAFKYLILSSVATVLMLSGVGLMFLFAGSTDFSAVATALQNGRGELLLKLAIACFGCGLLIKGGLVPFHGWLPDAYQAAPSAISVLLAGIVTKASGIYALFRLGLEFPVMLQALAPALLAVGAISMVVGALLALRQNSIKRLLAYSSISQVGYIVLGLGCAGAGGTAGKLGMAAAIFHLFNHTIFKSLLFVNAAALEQRAGSSDMSVIGGLGRRMPVTSTSSAIAALSTAGIPPLAGFWSKLILIIALFQAGHPIYGTLAVFVGLLTLGYMLIMQRRVFFGKVREDMVGVREASAGIVLVEAALALITIGAGVLLPYVMDTFLLPLKGGF
jgi:multicomponent Na+:H+ antiporter subunit D